MGFIGGLLLTGVVAYMIYQLVSSREKRLEARKELMKAPLEQAAIWIGVLFALAFFWGLLIPKFGSIKVPLGGHRALDLWQAAGIASLVWFFILWNIPRR